MPTPLYRFSDAAVVEPLVHEWHACTSNIAPPLSALHVANYQLPALEGFVADPGYSAVKARFRNAGVDEEEIRQRIHGGPFVNIPAEQADAVERLLSDMKEHRGSDLAFARDFFAFDEVLQKEARGQSLQPFYARLPQSLRGRVELLYDGRNHPFIRVLGSVARDSPLDPLRFQSFSVFAQRKDNERKHFMSTPRIAKEGSIRMRAGFTSPEAAALYSLFEKPRPLPEIATLLGVSHDHPELAALLTSASSEPHAPRYEGRGIRHRYFGHACLLIEAGGTAILTDANLGVRPTDERVERLSYSDLPEHIDYVLITHGHADHFLLEVLLRLRSRIGCLALPKAGGLFYGEPSMRRVAKQIGLDSVKEVEDFDTIPIAGGEIVAVPFLGEHADLPFQKTGYVIRFGGNNILVGADSKCLDVEIYHSMRRAFGPVETVFLGMECEGAPLRVYYGGLWSHVRDQQVEADRRTSGCNAQEASALLSALGAKQLYVYAMGMEPWLGYLALPAERFSPNSSYGEEVERITEIGAATGMKVHVTYLNLEVEL